MCNYDYRPDLKELEDQQELIQKRIKQAEFIKWLKQRYQKDIGKLG